jgi:hypothetical protein
MNSFMGSGTFESGYSEKRKKGYVNSLATIPNLLLIRVKRTQAWSVFWNALSFNPHIPPSQSLSFRSRISELFQLPPPNAATPALKLKAGVMDLEGLDIKVVPTLNLDEHMTLEEDTLRILKLTSESWNLCLTYHENVVAK